MQLLRAIDDLFKRSLAIPASPYLVVIVPIIVGCVRAAQEHMWLPALGDDTYKMAGVPTLVAHTYLMVLFYAIVQVMLAGGLAIASRRSASELLGPVSVGLVFAWLPPVINLFVPGPHRQGYTFFFAYDLDFFVGHQSWGESITLWLVVAICGAFVLWLTRSVWRALAGMVLAYATLQFVGWGWLALSRQLAELSGTDESTRATSPLVMALTNLVGVVTIFVVHHIQRRRALLPSLIRVNHSLPWGLVTAIAARLAAIPWPEAVLRGVVMTLAFQLVVVANDYLDREQDSGAGGSARPVGHEDYVMAVYLQILLAIWAMFYRPIGFYAVVLFFALFTLYHLPPLRLKRLFCGGYRTEGFAAGACVLFGAHSESIGSWLPVVTLLVVGGFSVGAWFKDYKDIDQDWAAGVGTIYTRYMKRGRSLSGIHTFVRIALCAMLLVPPVWLLSKGEPWLPAVGLVLLDALIGVWLLGLGNKKLAVESSFWALDGYLLLLLLAVPALG